MTEPGPARPPRVLHLITRLDPGGSSAVVLGLAGRRSSESTLVASGPGASPVQPGIRTVAHLVREIRLLRDFRAFLEIFRLLGEVEPDILHTHTSKAGFLGRWAVWCRNLAGGKIRTVHTPTGRSSAAISGR